jgi:hypothetical protein
MYGFKGFKWVSVSVLLVAVLLVTGLFTEVSADTGIEDAWFKKILPATIESVDDYYDMEKPDRTTPEGLLRSYFYELYAACNLNEQECGIAGGTVGSMQEPYPEAYQHFSDKWKKENSYEDYLRSWEGTANVELLKCIEIPQSGNAKKFFIEYKTVESKEKNDDVQFGLFYYWGYATVENIAAEGGWKITQIETKPENMAWVFGGHQSWLGDCDYVAMLELWDNVQDYFEEESQIEVQEVNNSDGSVTVQFIKDGKVQRKGVVVKKADNICEFLYEPLP